VIGEMHGVVHHQVTHPLFVLGEFDVVLFGDEPVRNLEARLLIDLPRPHQRQRVIFKEFAGTPERKVAPYVWLRWRVCEGTSRLAHSSSGSSLLILPLGKPQLERECQPLTSRHLSRAVLSRMAPHTGTRVL
jgi:hypothetical protein